MTNKMIMKSFKFIFDFLSLFCKTNCKRFNYDDFIRYELICLSNKIYLSTIYISHVKCVWQCPSVPILRLLHVTDGEEYLGSKT